MKPAIAKSIMRSTRRPRTRRGAEVIELAILMLPLLWLTFGAIDYGWYFYLQHNLEGAAREGARAGIIQGNTDADVKSAVKLIMDNAGIKDTNAYSVDVEFTGNNVTVTVSMNYQAMGIPPARVTKKEVVGEATMRVEAF